jgi:hypothetical protein
MPAVWQRRFNDSAVEVRPRIDDPVDPAIVAELSARFPDFVRAYEPDGLAVDEFDEFPATARTLRAFIASYHELLHLVTDAAIPNPDAGAVTEAVPGTRWHRRAGRSCGRAVGARALARGSRLVVQRAAVATLPAWRRGRVRHGPDEVAILPLAGSSLSTATVPGPS